MRRSMDIQEGRRAWAMEGSIGREGHGAATRPTRRGQVNLGITAEREQAEQPATPPDAPLVMRSFYIRRSDVAVHGRTPGCKRCIALRMQKPPQGHPDARRGRVVDLLQGRPDAKRRAQRAEESRQAKLARHIENQGRARPQEGVREGTSRDNGQVSTIRQRSRLGQCAASLLPASWVTEGRGVVRCNPSVDRYAAQTAAAQNPTPVLCTDASARLGGDAVAAAPGLRREALAQGGQRSAYLGALPGVSSRIDFIGVPQAPGAPRGGPRRRMACAAQRRRSAAARPSAGTRDHRARRAPGGARSRRWGRRRAGCGHDVGAGRGWAQARAPLRRSCAALRRQAAQKEPSCGRWSAFSRWPRPTAPTRESSTPPERSRFRMGMPAGNEVRQPSACVSSALPFRSVSRCVRARRRAWRLIWWGSFAMDPFHTRCRRPTHRRRPRTWANCSG